MSRHGLPSRRRQKSNWSSSGGPRHTSPDRWCEKPTQDPLRTRQVLPVARKATQRTRPDYGRNMMNALKNWVATAAMLAATLAAEPGQAQADPIADFYRGKTLRVIIGYGAGGGYDIYGRLAAEFLGRHIPGNPTIVAVNMPGGSSLKAVEYLYQVAPK